ncbi:hypothetical protein KP509_10G058600 [Ceratopteris richardii]|uniref:Alpha-mannosidase n=1 Tax=Ceratopteris richardii TaxID=49495 RepID=A0A8T2TZD9_CERRI|nr:hypothetical protein KP509_10G058600 [Ceratopteris richardii]KAH7427758.1 hypothetical protein KP509_10G058600 [Ceratopteris richardii]
MIWQPSRTLGDSAQIFTGAFYDFYYPPSGFNFDMDSFDTPIQDDPFLFDFNVEERVNDFVAYAETQASHMRTNHIMWTLGGDFQYQNAHGWFKQLDKFINWVNKDGRVNAFYSTPSIYTDEKYAANETWPLKQGDFFPYADCPHCYWTGYFTSRPALKGYVRLLSNYFMMARQLEFFVGRNPNGPNTDALWEALAVSQHHDAVSGTEKQHTANDYALRLSIAYQEAEKLVNSAFGCLVENVPKGICHSPKMQFFQCQLLNLSFCPLSESVDEMGGTLVVLVYNSLTWNRTEYIRIPVNSIHLQVMDSRGILVPSQLLPINSRLKELRRKYVKGYLGTSGGSTARYWLVFLATVPALGLNTYTISVSNEGSASASIIESMPKGSSATIRNNYLKMTLSESGLLSSIVKTGPEGNLSVESSYLYYEGNPGNDTKGADGAYLFRPIRNSASRLSISENISLITGPLVHEVWQEFSPWIHQVYRLYEGKDHVEVEYFIGPIPIDDGIGKDVIVRFSTSIDSNGVFFTDSNGRDFLKRVRDHRADWDLEVNEPVAGNYYPVNLGMYLNDDKTEFSVLVDRSVGGSSLANGQLELMLHRRLIHDDGRGVGEPLNETVCIESVCEGLIVQGKLYMQFNPSNKGSSWRRSMGQQVYSPLQLAFSSVSDGESWADNSFHSFSAMSTDYNLPENVALITLQELNTGQTLLRLAHLYEISIMRHSWTCPAKTSNQDSHNSIHYEANEDDELSTKAYVDLKKMFPKRQVKSIVETSLSANQEISKMRGRLKWRVERPDETIQVVERGGPVDHQNLIVELTPMEIRTFLLKFTEVIAL